MGDPIEAGIGAHLPAGFIEKHGLTDPSTLALDIEGDAPVPIVIENYKAAIASDPIVERANLMLAKAADMQVTDRPSRDSASVTLIAIRKGSKRIEAIRKEAIRPFRDIEGAINGAAKELKAPLDEAGNRIDKMIGDWLASEEVLAASLGATAENAAREAMAAAGREGLPIEVYVAPPPKSVDTPEGKVTAVRRWKYTITNAAEVPREYCAPSPSLINDAIRNGVRYIPGVLIEQVDKQSVREG